MLLLRSASLLAVAASALTAHAGLLGEDDALVSGAYTGSSSDVEGTLAAGGTVRLMNYSVGLGLTGGTLDALLSGGAVTFGAGTVYGNVVAAGSIAATGLTYANGGQPRPNDPSVRQTVIDRFAFAKPLADSLRLRSANGSASFQSGTLIFAGTDASLNVFEVSATSLSSANGFDIRVPAGSTAVVNVRGTTASVANKSFGSRFDPVRTLWNFSEATSLTLTGVAFQGSVLAPSASVLANDGRIDGQVVGASFDGTAAIDARYFVGAVPEPSALAALGLGGVAVLRRRKRV